MSSDIAYRAEQEQARRHVVLGGRKTGGTHFVHEVGAVVDGIPALHGFGVCPDGAPAQAPHRVCALVEHGAAPIAAHMLGLREMHTAYL